jgi:hypothetical protein
MMRGSTFVALTALVAFGCTHAADQPPPAPPPAPLAPLPTLASTAPAPAPTDSPPPSGIAPDWKFPAIKD